MVQGLGSIMVQGLGFRALGSEFWVLGSQYIEPEEAL